MNWNQATIEIDGIEIEGLATKWVSEDGKFVIRKSGGYWYLTASMEPTMLMHPFDSAEGVKSYFDWMEANPCSYITCSSAQGKP